MDLKKIKYSSKDFSFSISHATSSKKIKKIALLIKPKIQIEHMSARFYYSTDLSTVKIILIVGISLFIFIAIILIIIYAIKKGKGTSKDIEYSENQPLYKES